MFAWASEQFDKISQTVAPPPTDSIGRFVYCTQRNDESGAQGCLAEMDPLQTVVQPNKGTFPLHLACQHGMERLIRQIMGIPGANVQIVDSVGNTPLHYAAMSTEKTNINVVRLLVSQFGASVVAKNMHGQTPYDVATLNGIRQFLLPLQLQQETQHALDNGGVGLPPGIDMGGLRIKNSNLPPPPIGGVASPHNPVAGGPPGMLATPSPTMPPPPTTTTTHPAPAQTTIPPAPSSGPHTYARSGGSSAAIYKADKRSNFVQADGFHSSSSDMNLQRKYGNSAPSSGNIAPPPSSGGAPPPQMNLASNPYSLGGGVRSRYLAYDATTGGTSTTMPTQNAYRQPPPPAANYSMFYPGGGPIQRSTSAPAISHPAPSTFMPPPPYSNPPSQQPPSAEQTTYPHGDLPQPTQSFEQQTPSSGYPAMPSQAPMAHSKSVGAFPAPPAVATFGSPLPKANGPAMGGFSSPAVAVQTSATSFATPQSQYPPSAAATFGTSAVATPSAAESLGIPTPSNVAAQEQTAAAPMSVNPEQQVPAMSPAADAFANPAPLQNASGATTASDVFSNKAQGATGSPPGGWQQPQQQQAPSAAEAFSSPAPKAVQSQAEREPISDAAQPIVGAPSAAGWQQQVSSTLSATEAFSTPAPTKQLGAGATKAVDVVSSVVQPTGVVATSQSTADVFANPPNSSFGVQGDPTTSGSSAADVFGGPSPEKVAPSTPSEQVVEATTAVESSGSAADLFAGPSPDKPGTSVVLTHTSGKTDAVADAKELFNETVPAEPHAHVESMPSSAADVFGAPPEASQNPSQQDSLVSSLATNGSVAVSTKPPENGPPAKATEETADEGMIDVPLSPRGTNFPPPSVSSTQPAPAATTAAQLFGLPPPPFSSK